MADIKLHEQLASLRKQKGLTQEGLAQIFGVTNQSVSKWESGACCPDISLLPDIANFFGTLTKNEKPTKIITNGVRRYAVSRKA